MENNRYLIAANSKRAQLIFNIFRKIDLYIALSGLGLTIVLFLIFQPETLVSGILILLPALICAFLVIPVANYHNILCVLQNIYKFYFMDRQSYIWRGWCVKDEYE